MKDYQPQRNNPYLLPQTVWHRTLWDIRCYGYYSQNPDRPAGARIIAAVDAVREALPDDLAQVVYDNIVYSKPYPPGASNLYTMAKCKFVYDLARTLEWTQKEG